MAIYGTADISDRKRCSMYFQFLIEDRSTGILVEHVMEKLREQYPDRDIFFDIKSFKGIGHLKKTGTLLERKSGNLLNDLPCYLRGFDKKLKDMERSAIVIIMDNDTRDQEEFSAQLEEVAREAVQNTDYVFCIAVKEMEAWLLGDENAIVSAYPQAKKKYIKAYEQDTIGETWEMLANAVYPGGLAALKKKSKSSYSETGKAKCEWADKIGKNLTPDENKSPSFQHFFSELTARIQTA